MHVVDIDKIYEEIGARVRSARLKADVNQDTLAAYLGLTRTSVTNIENGRQRPSIHLLILIAKCLEIDMLALLPNDATETISDNKFSRMNKKEIISSSKISSKTEESFLNFLNSIKKH